MSLGVDAVAQPGGGAPAQDFAIPPSGEIPILFNDHHVYANPDKLNEKLPDLDSKFSVISAPYVGLGLHL